MFHVDAINWKLNKYNRYSALSEVIMIKSIIITIPINILLE